VLPCRGTAKWRPALLSMPWVSQKRRTIWCLGLFQQSLPQVLLQLRQCYSAKFSAYGEVNVRTLCVEKAEGVLPAKGI